MSRAVPAAPLRLALIPGDGIGREVIPAARRVLEATGAPLEFVELEAGWGAFERTGAALPAATLAALRSCRGALFGAVSSPTHRVEGYSSPIVALRRELDLYANLRPAQSAPVAESRPGIDLLIVRENTEDLYVKEEVLEDGGERAVARRVITRRASARIAHTAFRRAQQRAAALGRPGKVTVVHKANVLSLTDGLFRSTALDIAQMYPDVAVEEAIVDALLYHLIRRPQRYDVLVAPNLYGDLVSDVAAALVGGLGLMPSANRGDSFVLAEPVHGSAPDIAGQGIANPIAAIRAAGLLLGELGLAAQGAAVLAAADAALAAGPWTPDLGGAARSEDVTTAVLAYLAGSAQPVEP